MNKLIVLLFLGLFLFTACGTINKNCNGSKKIKSEMW